MQHVNPTTDCTLTVPVQSLDKGGGWCWWSLV